jgi:hypothetical protein
MNDSDSENSAKQMCLEFLQNRGFDEEFVRFLKYYRNLSRIDAEELVGDLRRRYLGESTFVNAPLETENIPALAPSTIITSTPTNPPLETPTIVTPGPTKTIDARVTELAKEFDEGLKLSQLYFFNFN